MMRASSFNRLLPLAALAALAVFLAVTATGAPPAQAQATEIRVDANCTLAEAINEANGATTDVGDCEAGTDGAGAAGHDTIVLTRNITLSAHPPNITSHVTINGNNRTINGANQYRPINIEAGGVTLVLNNLTLTRGRAEHNEEGGAIQIDPPSGQSAEVTLNRVTVSDSSTVDEYDGGGIYCGEGTLTINDSVVTGNTGNGAVNTRCATTVTRSAFHGNTGDSWGGALRVVGGGYLVISNSTIYNNTSEGRASAINLATTNASNINRITHVTITGNNPHINALENASALETTNANTRLELRNSIVHGNSGGDCHRLSGGVPVNQNNVIGQAVNCGTATGGTGDDPLLPERPTGAIPYFVIPANSPAADLGGDCAALTPAVTEDQRGQMRPQGLGCDAGAYETTEQVRRTYEIVGVDHACDTDIANVHVKVSPRIPLGTSDTSDPTVVSITTEVTGTASSADFSVGTSTLAYSFFAGDADDTIQFPVALTTDTVFEGNEYFGVRLSSSYAGISPGAVTSASVFICDGNMNIAASSSTSATGTFSTVALSPVFRASGSTGYTATVAYDQTHVKLTPTWVGGAHEVRVGKLGSLAAATSGTASTALELNPGVNHLMVRVRPSGTSTVTWREYHVRIIRSWGDTNADLSTLELHTRTSETGSRTLFPSLFFSSGTTRYAVTVGSSVTHVNFLADASRSHLGAEEWVGKQGETLTQVPGNNLSQTMALEDGPNTFLIRVTAQDPAHTKTYSVIVTRRYAGPPNLQAAVSSGALAVSWDEPGGDPISYDVQYKTQNAPNQAAPHGHRGDPTRGWVQTNQIDRTIDIGGLTGGTTYDVRVRAWFSDGPESAWATLRAALVAPGAPRSVSANGRANRLAVSWNAPSSGQAARYEVQHKLASGSAWSGSAQTTERSWTIGELVGGLSYNVRVRAVNAIGPGPWASASGSPLAGPAEVDRTGKATTGRIHCGLAGTGDLSISIPQPETVAWQQFQPGAELEAQVTDPGVSRFSGTSNVVPTADATWKWYRGSAEVSGIPDRPDDYKVVAADVGQRIRVEATYRVRASYDQNDADYNVFGPEQTVSCTYPIPVQRYRDPKVNQVPAFASDMVTISVPENSQGDIGAPLRATDPDGDILTYSVRVSGDNAIGFRVPRFTIDNATGQLALAPYANLNYEAPGDSNGDNVYHIQVRAYDSSANNTGAETNPQVRVEAAVRVEVGDVNEYPAFSADSPGGLLAQTEGRTAIDLDDDRTTTPNDLATFKASDPEGRPIALSLIGPDADAFQLAADTDNTNAVSRVLSFKAVTDFDMPADSNRDNTYEVTVRASDPAQSGQSWSRNTDRSLTIKVFHQSTIEEWTPTLTAQDLGNGVRGCRNSVAGAECSAESVLTGDDFRYTRFVYREPQTWNFQVEELYLDGDELVLVANAAFAGGKGAPAPYQPLANAFFRDFALTVRGSGGVTEKFHFKQASLDGSQARWQSAGLHWTLNEEITLGMERPRGVLDSVSVHYDGITSRYRNGVDNFRHWIPASAASYGLRVNLPGEFPSIDQGKGTVAVTHAKLGLYSAHSGVTIKVGKVTWDSQGNRQVTLAAAPVGGELSNAIELNSHLPNTIVDIEVSDGDVVTTHLLNIDPPTRTYSLTPQARVTEGQDARLILSLSEPAPEGGLEFTATAAYPASGATADDVGAITSPVKVPEGFTSRGITVPTVDDDHAEDDESFTVTVAPTRFGWGADLTGTDTATVTIVDNDDAGAQASAQSLLERCAAHLPANAISVAEVTGWRDAHSQDATHVLRWNRVLEALGEDTGTGAAPMTVAESKANELRFMRTRWSRVTGTLEGIASCVAAQQQPAPANQAPTVSSAIADATIVNQSGTHQVSLSGTFSDADNDSLTITAATSDQTKATVSVASDYSGLTVTAQARGTATITVTASDGNGGTVSDAFTVTVKAAPTVAAAIADVSGLEVDATQDVSLSGVFSDADGDALTITAASSDETKATVTVAADQSKLTLTGVAVGTATITVTAQDADGNTVTDAFDAPVAKKYTALIAQMYEWRNGPEAQQYGKPHTDRWDRALLAFGETVADPSITPMTAAEAQALADQDWGVRWIPVAAALREIEGG